MVEDWTLSFDFADPVGLYLNDEGGCLGGVDESSRVSTACMGEMVCGDEEGREGVDRPLLREKKDTMVICTVPHSGGVGAGLAAGCAARRKMSG